MSAPRGTDSTVTVAHFDAIADRYRGLYDEQTSIGYSFVTRRQRVLDLFGAVRGRVLDVGCGPGVMGDALSDRGCAFVGVDPSLRMIQSAKAAHPSSPTMHFMVGSAESLCFPDESFDAVICMGVIERIADDQAALQEMVRVLKPGGTFIVTMPNKYSPYLLWRDEVFYRLVSRLNGVRRLFGRESGSVAVRGHRRYTRRAYSITVDRLRCDVVAFEYCIYSAFISPLDTLFPRGAAVFMQRAEFLHRTPLRASGSALVVKATKRA